MAVFQKCAVFDYSAIPFLHWKDSLKILRESGVARVRVPLRWGAHEPVQGIRDFAKSPRLRLEKMLQIAHDLNLEVELQLGFASHEEALPSWLRGIEEKSLVPAGTHAERLGLAHAPSFFADAFQKAYIEFLAEAATLFSLYYQPEGSLVGVAFDPGIYQFALDFLRFDSLYASALALRYQEVKMMNVFYQASYKNFLAALQPAALKHQMEKRPWVMAYDYQWCRRQILEGWKTQLGEQLQLRLVKRDPVEELPIKGCLLVFDPTQIQWDAERRARPLLIQGEAWEPALRAFQVVDYCVSQASREHMSYRPLPVAEGEDLPDAENIVVLCGKHLPDTAVKVLRRKLEKGIPVRFSLGVPEYDQNLFHYSWKEWSSLVRVDTSTTDVSSLWQNLRKRLGAIHET